jgi:hypothetical protein
MSVIGWIAVALLAVAILAVIVFAVSSIPDINRYRRLRKM